MTKKRNPMGHGRNGRVDGNRRRWTTRLAGACRAFLAARDGSLAIFFGLSFIPLMIAVGVGIDLGRAYVVKNRLIHTTDAAGLAVGAAYDSGQNLQTILNNYFSANFPSGGLGTVDSSGYTVTGNVITVTSQATVETTFMKIAGINSVTVGATSQITRNETGLELVMVLDNSTSMILPSSKLTALKSAANSLVTTLFGSDTAPTNLKIGLVPFTNNVNIGSSNTAYVNNPTTPSPPLNWGSTSWGGCVLANTTSDNDTKDDYTGPWEVMYWPDDGNNNWYYSGSSHISSSLGPNKYCPTAITPLTNNKTTLTTAINAMAANGYTHVPFGTVWGWRVLSPSAPFTEGVAYGTSGWKKAIIILTDGQNLTSDNAYGAYKYPSDGVIPGVTTAAALVTALDSRMATICTNIKAVDITIYTILFDLSDATVEAIFQACASDTSKYYNSPTTAELSRAFRAIAADLKKLRVSG